VTGASLGIGRAVAEELAREGCDVAIVARTEDTLQRAADDIARATGRRVIAVPADASVPEAIVNAVERASQQLGGSIDILVNNAGSTPEDGIDHVEFVLSSLVEIWKTAASRAATPIDRRCNGSSTTYRLAKST